VGDRKRLKEMDRRNTCLHESAHSVVRQLTIGDLHEVRVVRGGESYSYPAERKPFDEMDRNELAKLAPSLAAGIFAEAELCSRVGDQDSALADDMRQWEGIRRFGGFSDEEMEAFMQEAAETVRANEGVIRKVALELDRRHRLMGEQVTRIIATHQA
jgi:hypothetical protein